MPVTMDNMGNRFYPEPCGKPARRYYRISDDTLTITWARCIKHSEGIHREARITWAEYMVSMVMES